MSSNDQLYLRHILDAVTIIESYTSVGYDEFMAASHWQDATMRQLEIIGEATKRLSPSLRRQNEKMPWRRVAGLRDVLIHQYMGVDIAAVWEITQKDLPPFKQKIEMILENLSNA